MKKGSHIYVTVEVDMDINMKDESAVNQLKQDIYSLVSVKGKNRSEYFIKNYHILSAFDEKGTPII